MRYPKVCICFRDRHTQELMDVRAAGRRREALLGLRPTRQSTIRPGVRLKLSTLGLRRPVKLVGPIHQVDRASHYRRDHRPQECAQP